MTSSADRLQQAYSETYVDKYSVSFASVDKEKKELKAEITDKDGNKINITATLTDQAVQYLSEKSGEVYKKEVAQWLDKEIFNHVDNQITPGTNPSRIDVSYKGGISMNITPLVQSSVASIRRMASSANVIPAAMESAEEVGTPKNIESMLKEMENNPDAFRKLTSQQYAGYKTYIQSNEAKARIPVLIQQPRYQKALINSKAEEFVKDILNSVDNKDQNRNYIENQREMKAEEKELPNWNMRVILNAMFDPKQFQKMSQREKDSLLEYIGANKEAINELINKYPDFVRNLKYSHDTDIVFAILKMLPKNEAMAILQGRVDVQAENKEFDDNSLELLEQMKKSYRADLQEGKSE